MKSNRILCSCLITLLLSHNVATALGDVLEEGFRRPPDSAKPQTWWHWMNGNITKAGITADLEAMKEIGLGGATIVIVDCEIPRGPVPFMSAEWRDDFKFAVQEANRLGLALCVENCAGWSSSGGPWNTLQNAMRRLTSSEIRVTGPAAFHDALPQPPVTLGFYRDIAVLAFKVPVQAGADTGSTPPAKLEIQHAVYEAMDGSGSADVRATIVSQLKNGQYAFPVGNEELGGDPAYLHVKQLRVEYTLDGKPGVATAEEGETLVLPRNARELALARTRVKTSANRTFVRPTSSGVSSSGEAISREDTLDLTAKLLPDGKLMWDVPEGDWVVLRLGYTPTGKDNHPAPKEGTGLECDKFSKTALDVHWAGFMAKILADIGPLAGKTLNTSLIDSYEVGGQDWTADFRAEFQRRRGYDPLRFLPTFTGRVVDSPEITERFLWDMRRTIADLFAENYFGHFAELCRRNGLLNAVEPYTGPFESLQCGAPADVVMGEFWTGSQGHPSVKLAASIAHIYGKTIVGAESFTAGPEHGRWQNDPYSLKTLGDLMYCQGLNRYIFHRYAMQPWTDRWPGMTMGQWGFHFERTVTWWEQGKPWIDYISRCQFLLQQGRAVVDVAYFTGESAPVEMRVGNPPLPSGYDYDAVNSDVLLHGATAKDGRLTLASGANYAALVLPPDDANMTPEVMEALRGLVRAGATVIGARPQRSPSLAGYPNCDTRVKELADELWAKCDGQSVRENVVSKGRVVWGKSLADVLATQNLLPDFEFRRGSDATKLAFAHRVDGDADIYFVSNQRRHFDSAECTFRVSGKVPELWRPETGHIGPAPVWSTTTGRTKVRLDFEPAESVFVIFRSAVPPTDHVVAVNTDFDAETVQRPKPKIQKALYGALDGGGKMDVTARLSGMARDGQLDVPVSNDFFGRDPAPNQVKELRVDYSLDGKPGHVTVREGETFTLPGSFALGEPPQWNASVSGEGVPVVKAWGNGQIELKMASGKVLRAEAVEIPAPLEITGAWNLSFPPNWGAPPSVTLDRLISWTDHETDGVRYFSGTATYEKGVEIPDERFSPGCELWLDLGAVKNFAQVSLNGHEFGVLWKPPFRVNVTSVAKPGANRLIIKVTNLWPNRLIGDEQLPPDCEWNGKQLRGWPQWLLDGKPSPTGRLTFTTWHHWTKDSKLLESGLLGPVMLRTAEIIPAD